MVRFDKGRTVPTNSVPIVHVSDDQSVSTVGPVITDVGWSNVPGTNGVLLVRGERVAELLSR